MVIALTFTGDTPTSISLTSIIRLDTSAELLGSPAAMTLSGGSWNYTFSEPAAGLTYRYQYTVTWSDATTFPGEGTFTGTAVSDGYYVKRAKVINTAGQDNFDVGFNLDNDATVADETIAQALFDQGDRLVDSIGMDIGYTAESGATLPHLLATTNVIFDMIGDWASRWARAQGYLLRGVTGAEDAAKAEGQMTNMKEEAETQIQRLFIVARSSQLAASGSYGAEVIRARHHHCHPWPVNSYPWGW